MEEEERLREIIGLRMKEYESLRGEITQRISARQQMAGFAALLTAIGVTLAGDLRWWRFAVVALVLVGGVTYLHNSNKGIQRLGLYLREVEGDINALTTRLYGHSTLAWEGRRQGQRNDESRFLRVVGILGGWHVRDAGQAPSPAPSTSRGTGGRTGTP
ncbi:hypothetical protein [Streptomyces triticirhizae]|uniref:SLATT domain-containing protein n=1 Tax=Streptomyces triticirhizae TaxID=2483353 RepID=A0A3M2LG99_9ACTN|nr:hypothetical protein [Streptomyces triticirhizae]RMI33748.1 hypothetical protein EBN88_24410 [Streptomyces triticirhizae]